MKKVILVSKIVLYYFIISIFLGIIINYFNFSENFLSFFFGPILVFLHGFGIKELILFFQFSFIILFLTIPLLIFKCGGTIIFFIIGVFVWFFFGFAILCIPC